MDTNVHKSIVNAAAKLLPAEVKSYLTGAINSGPYEGKTRLELLLLGSVIEDDIHNPGPLPSPDLQRIPSDILPGAYWPWMEHFWNPHLEEGKGLTITTKLLGELFNIPLKALTSLIHGDFDMNEVLGQFRSAVDRALDYWNDHVLPNYIQGNEADTFLCLGRICHLLTDVGTPCHIHNDPHLNIFDFYDDDDYEKYTSVKTDLVGDGHLPKEWDVPSYTNIVYNPNWDLPMYFRELGKISRLYDSDDVDGWGEGHPYHWDHYDDSFINILPIDRDISGDLTDLACDAIAADLIPINIMFVAGVICHFFKTIDFKMSLDVLEVTIKRLNVHEDTDPFGKGEIYLSASLNNQYLYPVGGKYSLHSGTSKNIIGARYPIAICDRDIPVHFYAKAYDDDSTYFWNDSESLGSIDYEINLNDLTDGTPQLVTAFSKGGEGSFSLVLEICIHLCQGEERQFDSMINLTPYMVDPQPLHATRFDRSRYVPAILNLKSLALHEYADKGRRICDRWNHLKDEKKLAIYMYKEEIFKETEGKTKLQLIVERVFGEDSKQVTWVKDVKDYKGYCACVRKGKSDKLIHE
ncbi:hypothetical protein I5677_02830 [Mobilitalea sibirica]|uniref:Uncharacterized protein n=1 Tax=Mobilitalea sibirica TaxID=1462919 RepID=A0A8J7KZB0_9FIRM|nr:hypothetical protein [Mobilitalea sibirica]MBH1939828.1 hypothetical protein [Mobilitalea sibirica]